jgi:hypothetical protein
MSALFSSDAVGSIFLRLLNMLLDFCGFLLCFGMLFYRHFVSASAAERAKAKQRAKKFHVCVPVSLLQKVLLKQAFRQIVLVSVRHDVDTKFRHPRVTSKAVGA